MIEYSKNRLWIFIAISLGLLFLGSIFNIDNFNGLFFLTFLFFIIYIIFYNSDAELKHVVISAFLIRTLFVLINTYIVPLPDTQVDAIKFISTAQKISNGSVIAIIQNFTVGAYLYSWILSILFFLLGKNILIAESLNVFLGTLIVYNVYKISFYLWDRSSAIKSAWITAFLPTLVLYSSIPLREAFIVYFYTLALIFFLKYIKKKFIFYALIAIIFFRFSSLFHRGIIVGLTIMVILLAFEIIYHESYSFYIKFFRVLIIVILFFASISIFKWQLFSLLGINLIPTAPLTEKEINKTQLNSIIHHISSFEKIAARDRCAYLKNLHIRSFFDLIWQTPIRVIYFIYAPFPWMIEKLKDLLGIIYSFLNIFLTFTFIKTITNFKENIKKEWFLLFLILISMVITFSLGTFNYGTSIRHFSKFLPLFIALIKW